MVVSLSGDGLGSLRRAIREKGPRTILFAASGIVALKSPLNTINRDLMIAGQSAPGYGICIKNYLVNTKEDNVVVRCMRFRLGSEQEQKADPLGANKGKNSSIIDQCSVSWATDEASFFFGNKGFTLQSSVVSVSLNRSVHTESD